MSLCPYAAKNDGRCYVHQQTPEATPLANAYCYDAYQRCAIYKEFVALGVTAPAVAGHGGGDPALEPIKRALREVLNEEHNLEAAPIGARWKGGTAILRPKDPAQASREIPIEMLFKKVTAIRDRLRVLEQKINAHSGLSDEDKATFQDYITKSYGTLTTFNLLFREERDKFVGEKGKDG